MQIRTQQHVLSALIIVGGLAHPASGQTPELRIDGDSVTITGCVYGADTIIPQTDETLFWTAGDVMLAYATAAIESESGGAVPNNPFFYWLEQHDELSPHLGQVVEVRGTLGDFEEGRIEVERDDGFTDVTMDVNGDEESIRVPTEWIGPATDDDDAEFEIVVRMIDIDEVNVIGACR